MCSAGACETYCQQHCTVSHLHVVQVLLVQSVDSEGYANGPLTACKLYINPKEPWTQDVDQRPAIREMFAALTVKTNAVVSSELLS